MFSFPPRVVAEEEEDATQPTATWAESKCQACGDAQHLVEDRTSGAVVCTKCGIVQTGLPLLDMAGTIAGCVEVYDADANAPEMSDASLYTVITRIDQKGTSINGRLDQLNRYCAGERRLTSHKNRIQTHVASVCKKSLLSEKIRDDAVNYMMSYEATRKRDAKSNEIRPLAGACVYWSAIKHGIYVSEKEISMGLDNLCKTITKKKLIIQEEFKIQDYTPGQLVRMSIRRMCVSFHTTHLLKLCNPFITPLMKMQSLRGCHIQTIAATVLFSVATKNNAKAVTKKNLRHWFGISDNCITQCIERINEGIKTMAEEQQVV